MGYQTLTFLAALFDGGAVAGDGPQDLQALGADPAELPPADAGGDAAGPAAAGCDPGDASPSGTNRRTGQALPGADPLGADGPQDDHGDAAQALQPHGDAGGPHGADGPPDLAAVRQAAPRTRAAVPVATEWPTSAADFALLLAVDDLPLPPFRLNGWTEARDAGRFLSWLQADIRRGPSGPRARYGAIQRDLQDLQRFVLQAADKRQQERKHATIGARTGKRIETKHSC